MRVRVRARVPIAAAPKSLLNSILPHQAKRQQEEMKQAEAFP